MSVTRVLLPGGWTETAVSLGSRQLRLLHPADPDQLLDRLSDLSALVGNADPYWARLWPTSVQLAQWVAQQLWLAGRTTLDLGCGIGLVGMAAMVAGARTTFSDYVPLAIAAALENAERNGLAGASTMRFDWREPSPPQVFAVILGSDITYEPSVHPRVLEAIDRMLAPDGECILGDPGRYHTPDFLDLARRRGFEPELFGADGRPLVKPAVGDFQRIQLRRR